MRWRQRLQVFMVTVGGVLAEFPEIAFEMMNWDLELLKAKSSHGST